MSEYHVNLAGSDLHYPMGHSSSLKTLVLADGEADAFTVRDPTDAKNAFNLDTSGSQDVLTLGDSAYDLDVAIEGTGRLDIDHSSFLLRSGATIGGDAGMWAQLTATQFTGLAFDISAGEWYAGRTASGVDPLQTSAITIDNYDPFHAEYLVLEEITAPSPSCGIWSDSSGDLYFKSSAGTVQITSGGSLAGGGSDHAGSGTATWLSPSTGTCSGSYAVALGVSVDSRAARSVVIGYSATDYYSSTAQDDGVVIGSSAVVRGIQAVRIGVGGYANQGGVAVGYGSTTGQYSVALGHAAYSTANYATLLGAGSADSAYASSIAIGYSATVTAANQLVIGATGTNGYVTDLYLGAGVASNYAASRDVTIHATGGNSGYDGADLTLAAGVGGSATDAGGDLYFQTANHQTLSTVLQLVGAEDGDEKPTGALIQSCPSGGSGTKFSKSVQYTTHGSWAEVSSWDVASGKATAGYVVCKANRVTTGATGCWAGWFGVTNIGGTTEGGSDTTDAWFHEILLSTTAGTEGWEFEVTADDVNDKIKFRFKTTGGSATIDVEIHVFFIAQ